MTSLLDVNCLVALFDPAHVGHEPAHAWFSEHGASGWATCPLTENGLVRVISNPAYPGRRTMPRDALEKLEAFATNADHIFWPDSVSLRETISRKYLLGHRQITDLYLLALAVAQGGRLITFDRGISMHAVVGAQAKNLVLLGVG